MNTVAYHCPRNRRLASGVCKTSLVRPAKSCHMELGGLRGWEAVRDQTPFHKVTLPLLEDIRLEFMRGAGYKMCGVELAERTSSRLDDTEPRLLNLIVRRNSPPSSDLVEGNWSKLPPDLASRLSKGRKTGFYRRSTRLKSRTGLWSIRIEEKSLAVGFRRRKISYYSKPRTLRSETMVLSCRSRTFKGERWQRSRFDIYSGARE
jgi:hypothetical protein